MHDLTLLMTFSSGLAVALVFGFIAHSLKLSPIVGYLLAGIAVGQFSPGSIADHSVAEQLAEIGVILILFGIGLRFHLRELFSVWRVAVPGALIKSALSTFALAFALRLLGWDWIPGIILGMAISVASTVVLVLVLSERRDLHSPIGHIAVGWTVVEDLLTIVILLVLPILFAQDGVGHDGVAMALGFAAAKFFGLVASIALLGAWVIPWSLELIEKTRSRELFTLAVLVIAVGIAISSAKLFGVSIALGAFLAGLAVGRSEFAARAASDAVPMRDAFAVLFFVSVGMLFDPMSLLQAPLVTLTVIVVVLVVKPVTAIIAMRILGKPLTMAIPIGAAFAQIGEFSFVLGSVSRDLGLLNDVGWNALVAASILSIALNPSLYRLSRRWLYRLPRLSPIPSSDPPIVDPSRCILVGYGPIGKIVHTLLVNRGDEITVIDLNLDTVRRLKADGHAAVYGDVLRTGTLQEAGITTAGSLILSADVEDAAEIIRQCLILNPDLRVLVRCAHLRDADALRRAGASVVAAGEAEVGVALVEAVTADGELDSADTALEREMIRSRLYRASS